MSVPLIPIEVFYLFADADMLLLEKLEQHLSVLRQGGQITTWHRRQVSAGSDWKIVQDDKLNIASIILLLISPDFLASDSLYGMELQQAMQRHNANEACVIPVLLRSCDWRNTSFGKLQIIPRNEKPVASWDNQDEAFTEIAREIRLILETTPPLTMRLPQTTHPKIWQVPYVRNPFFTGRDECLTQIAQSFQQGRMIDFSQPQAVSGLGGIGKTQIAIEYAYRYRQNYQAVFWISADSIEALNSSYSHIARLLNLPQKDNQEQKIVVEAVKTWLHSNRDWLLIFDNADELKLLRDFLPSITDGHILFTTRATDLGGLGLGLTHPIQIEPFSLEEGSLFLLHRAKLLALDPSLSQVTSHDQDDVKKVVREMGGLPLALDLAGAYIAATKRNLAEYLDIYQHHHFELLKQHRNDVYPESVATTWNISFERVKAKNPAAIELMQLCAYLAPEIIPETIITEGAPYFGPILKSVATNDFLLAQAIEILGMYSLIARDYQNQTLSVHRLVQMVMRDTMSSELQLQWMKHAVQAVSNAFPSIEFANWSTCELLMPHALICVIWIEQEQMIFPIVVRLLNQAGYYLKVRARYLEADALFLRALAISMQSLGPVHPNTATTLNNLADLYQAQGHYTKAEPLYQQALLIRKQKLGINHPETAISLNNLALLYKDQGKYTEAELLYQDALATLEQVLGSEHQDTAGSLNNLADLYQAQGKYRQAEELYQRALMICEQKLGTNHPDTAGSLNNLASLYVLLQKYVEAEPMLLCALTIHEKLLGPEHPTTAANLNSLAALYNAQEKYKEAELLVRKALVIEKQMLGMNHPRTATSLHNLAALCEYQKRYEEAEPLYQQALAIREQVLGPIHSDTALSLSNLAVLYKTQGKYAEAEPLYLRALAIREQALGPKHPDTATSFNNLAAFYQTRKMYVEAESLYLQALAIYEQELGPEHSDTANSLNNLAILYKTQGKYAEAESLYLRVLAIREQALGSTHSKTVDTLYGLAKLHQKMEKYEQAEIFYYRALAIYEQQLGPEHPTTQIVRENYTFLLSKTECEREEGEANAE